MESDTHANLDISAEAINAVYPPVGAPNVDYKALYESSLADSNGFWGEQARSQLTWFRDFHNVQQGSFEEGDIAWFTGGKVRAAASHMLIAVINR
jgi:Acetyl-coenzyme A synthetase N-terminus